MNADWRASSSPGTEPPLPQELLDQVELIVRSSGFTGSEVLRNLLAFLAKQALDQPGHNPKEYEIATQVLGRPEGFDSRLDSTVRVHTGRLRSRLAEYYAGKGSADRVVIEIPKGAYHLSYFYRRPLPVPISEGRPKADVAPHRPAWWMLGWLFAVFATGAAILIWITSRPARPPAAVRAFWSGFTGASAEPVVVFANPLFVSSAEGLRQAPATGVPPDQAVDVYTGTGELIAVHELTQLFARFGCPFRLKRSNLLTWDEARNHNLVLVGGPETNGAVGETPRMQRFRFKPPAEEPHPGVSAIEDLSPQPGQQRYYLNSGRPYTSDYAVVALIPGSGVRSRILLLAGTTTLGTQAAVEYVLHEDTVSDLMGRLRVKGGQPVPWLEALLKVRISGGVPVQSELVAATLRR